MTRNFTAFLFIISGGVNCTSVSGTTWEGGEGRHLQNEGVHQEHLRWRHLHLREDHGSLPQTWLRGGAGSELQPQASPPSVQSCAGRRGRTAPTSPSTTTARGAPPWIGTIKCCSNYLRVVLWTDSCYSGAWRGVCRAWWSQLRSVIVISIIIMCPFKMTFYRSFWSSLDTFVIFMISMSRINFFNFV